MYQLLPPDSREFDDLVKLLSSFYLDVSSRGTFSYSKARLIHNELLEKEVGPPFRSGSTYHNVFSRNVRVFNVANSCVDRWEKLITGPVIQRTNFFWYVRDVSIYSSLDCVSVHREEERDEARRADRTRTDRIVLLLVPRKIQGKTPWIFFLHFLVHTSGAAKGTRNVCLHDFKLYIPFVGLHVIRHSSVTITGL